MASSTWVRLLVETSWRVMICAAVIAVIVSIASILPVVCEIFVIGQILTQQVAIILIFGIKSIPVLGKMRFGSCLCLTWCSVWLVVFARMK